MRRLSLALPLLSCLALACAEEEPKQTEIWDVRASPGVCDNGVDYQFCMRYIDVETQEGTSTYVNVNGFDYEWGYTYRIEVEVLEVEFHPDGFTTDYELIEILDKQPQPALEFDIDLTLASVDVEQGVGDVGYGHPFTCTPEQCAELESLLPSVYTQSVVGVFRFGPSEALFPLELVSVSIEE